MASNDNKTNHLSGVSQISRRQALAGIAAGAAVAFPMIVPARALGRDGAVAPSEKINLGVIGIGPRCTYDLTSMLGLDDVRCAAITDVQKSRREAGKAHVDKLAGNSDCMLYRDMREMLARKDIDAVIVATGDRWHTPASILAAEAGKDVYCEKPCGLSIKNVQDLAAAMKRTGRIFQAGTQRRSVPQFQTAVEMARSGKLGKLDTLHASVYMPELGNSWLPGEPTPAPDVCDWSLWLGAAPWRPYNSAYVAGKWRGQYDFESGARLLDWGAHTVDMCQWANSADGTTPIEFEPSPIGITCRYANGVNLFLDFLKTPFGDRSPNWNTKLGLCPVKFVGSEGSVEVGDDGIEVKLGGVVSPTEKIKKTRGIDAQTHARNFFDCVKSRKPTITNPDVMMHSHIASFAASFSWILGRKLTFDPVKNEFINDAEANSLRSRPERNCWA
ncbi:NADH-dependent dehydrogenase [Planctomycetia bacterium]|nr:NADH-dependent dehydrogenase [Planctomycetia bacterium]